MKIILCDQDLVNKHHLGVATVLDVIGHPEALVTDESQLGDFLDGSEGKRSVAELSRMVGRPLSWGSYVWEVGKWLEGA